MLHQSSLNGVNILGSRIGSLCSWPGYTSKIKFKTLLLFRQHLTNIHINPRSALYRTRLRVENSIWKNLNNQWPDSWCWWTNPITQNDFSHCFFPSSRLDYLFKHQHFQSLEFPFSTPSASLPFGFLLRLYRNECMKFSFH